MSLRISDEVRETLADGGAVVALESSLIAQGLPPPHNVQTALASEAAVREAGAVPATTALADGELVVGADMALIERLADLERPIAKAGVRDLGPLLATRRLAATTVSATMRLAALAGIRVMATGGIGGVHRGAGTSFDISSDIDELAATRVAVVCSGAKSMLDVPATFELLETRRVPVIGIGTDRVPVFYAAASSLRRRLSGGQRGGGGGHHPRPLRPPRQRRHAVRPATARRAGTGRRGGGGLDRRGTGGSGCCGHHRYRR